MTGAAVVAVDVGTGSARAGVFDLDGRMLGRAEQPIALNRPLPDHAEQSAKDIWSAVVGSVRAARASAGVDAEKVAGLSFDATCSLVALDHEDRPASVSTTGEDRWNVVVWLDHRAIAEAQTCTATGHEVLNSLGGTMSPEMEIPKLMWLKRHLPTAWARYGRVLDLADFLTFRACGSNARSCCTITCKWTYLAHEEPGWQDDFLTVVGLGDLRERTAVPARASAIGAPLGNLTADAAADMALTTSCTVGCGLIDAHAGALGVLGPALARGSEARPQSRADRGHLDLPHGAVRRTTAGERGVGPVLWRGRTRTVAERGRPVGDRRHCSTTSWPRMPRGRRWALVAMAWCSSESRPCAPSRARRSPRASWCCRISTATARRSPIRMHSA